MFLSNENGEHNFYSFSKMYNFDQWEVFYF